MSNARQMDGVIASVREEVVTGISFILLVMGGLALFTGFVRDLLMDRVGWLHLDLALFAYVAGLGLHLMRGRIAVKLRGGMLVGAMLSVGIHSILSFGLLAPAILLVPTTLLVSWMVFGGRGFGWLVGCVLVALLASVEFVVRCGTSMPSISVDVANSRPWFWVNYAMIQILAGAMVLETLRRVLGGLVLRESVARERRDHYRGLFDGLQDAIFIHDAGTGEVLDRNASAHALFGPGNGNPVGREVSNFPWCVGDPDDVFRQTLANGAMRRTCRSNRSGGEEIWTEVSLRTFSVVGRTRVVAMVRDVDESIRRRTELEGLNKGLDALVAERTSESESVRRELERMGKELSTELTERLESIEGMAGMLESRWGEGPDRERMSHLVRISSGARRMHELIATFRGLSRIDPVVSNRVEVDMTELARECCQEFFAGKVVRCAVEWFVEPLPPCTTEPILARQVFANLISNAYKAVEGCDDARIRIVGDSRTDGAWYGVLDNRLGFGFSDIEKMFEAIERIGEENRTGPGIGLATVQRILRRLGGGIEVQAAKEHGAEFWFYPGPSDAPVDPGSEAGLQEGGS